ncbi:osteoclast-associated immunoglobulin-like receptor isoform 2-T2 [Molossus nigricans]
MALMLILQLLTLWPLCHTDVTSDGTQEAQGPRLPMYLVPPAFHPTIRQPKPLGHMFKQLMGSVPPAPHPEMRSFKRRLSTDPFPPDAYRKFWPLKPPIFPAPPTPNPTFRPPMDSFPPAPYPGFWSFEPRPPIDSVPPNSYPEFWPFEPPIFPGPSPPNPTFRPPMDSFPPAPYPEIRPFKPRPPIDSVPPNSYPEFWPFEPPIFPGPSPPNPSFRPPMDSFPSTSYPKFRSPIDSDSPKSYLKPSLGAQPAAVVTPGVNVTLTCWAPLPARRFALFKSGELSSEYKDRYTQRAEFSLQEVTEAQGGSYHCKYQRLRFPQAVWSPPSDALELLVTDQLPRPTLVVLPGPVVAPGSNVSLRCAGPMGNMSFVLYRAGQETPLQYHESQQPWADFQLSGAPPGSTYTCYYHTPTVPYVLSQSSEPLVISSDGSGPLDYTKGNLIRLGLGGLVLIFLAVLGILEWRTGTGTLLAPDLEPQRTGSAHLQDAKRPQGSRAAAGCPG